MKAYLFCKEFYVPVLKKYHIVLATHIVVLDGIVFFIGASLDEQYNDIFHLPTGQLIGRTFINTDVSVGNIIADIYECIKSFPSHFYDNEIINDGDEVSKLSELANGVYFITNRPLSEV